MLRLAVMSNLSVLATKFDREKGVWIKESKDSRTLIIERARD
jgi:hypothetical protein